jgi:hypothetical protein
MSGLTTTGRPKPEVDVLVTRSTLRRWELLLAGKTDLSDRDAVVVAAGWARWHRVGGTSLVRDVECFAAAGFDVSQTVQWMSLGFDSQDADTFHGRWGATALEVNWLLPYMLDEDNELTANECWWGHLEAGVPVGLMCLLCWAGCDTEADLSAYVGRWRAGEDIEPGLRLLAAFRCTDEPVPPFDAPPQFPSP